MRPRIIVVLIIALGLSLALSLPARNLLSSAADGSDHSNRQHPCNNTAKCKNYLSNENERGHSYRIMTSAEDDADLEPGFPLKVLHTGGTYQAGQVIHTLVGNIDADSQLEIAFTGLASGPIYVLDIEGSQIGGWTTNTYSAGYPAMGNLSIADPDMEIFAVHFASTLLEAFSGAGEPLPGWPVVGTDYIKEVPAALADVDGDGLDEIFIGQHDRRMHAYRADGSLLPGWPSDSASSQRIFTPAIADIDGDNDLEIIYLTGRVNGRSALYAYHHDGDLIDSYPLILDSGYALSFPAVGDVDADGDPEIVLTKPGGLGRVETLILSAQGSIERTLTASGDYRLASVNYGTAPALADLDGDSVPEIIVQTDASIQVWRGDGSTVPGWPVFYGDIYDDIGYSSPVVGDVDGDQEPDIVVVSTIGGQAVTSFVRVYDSHGTSKTRFPKMIYAGHGAVPAIADFDSDSRNEIIVTGSYWNGAVGYFNKIWAYDLGGPKHGDIEWSQFGGGPKHRSAYPVAPLMSGTDLYVDGPLLTPIPPTNTVTFPIRYGNKGATVASSTAFTITVDSRLTYVEDTSGLVPLINDGVIAWRIPDTTHGEEREFTIRFQLPADIAYGNRFALSGEIISDGPESNVTDNSFLSEIWVARRSILPTVLK